jgi:hypothetical protein
MPTCLYYQITDAYVHALVGDGSHGKGERIQTFRCQSCRTTFGARRDTPLYRLKTQAPRVGEVLTALCEGLDVANTGWGAERALASTRLVVSHPRTYPTGRTTHPAASPDASSLAVAGD